MRKFPGHHSHLSDRSDNTGSPTSCVTRERPNPTFKEMLKPNGITKTSGFLHRDLGLGKPQYLNSLQTFYRMNIIGDNNISLLFSFASEKTPWATSSSTGPTHKNLVRVPALGASVQTSTAVPILLPLVLADIALVHWTKWTSSN